MLGLLIFGLDPELDEEIFYIYPSLWMLCCCLQNYIFNSLSPGGTYMHIDELGFHWFEQYQHNRMAF